MGCPRRTTALEKRADKRVQRLAVAGTDLWLKRRRDEEWMLGQLDRLNTGVNGARAEHDAGLLQAQLNRTLQAVATPMKPGEGLRTANLGKARPTDRLDHAPFAVERARQRDDDQRFAVGIVLRVSRSADPGQRARKRDARVLKSAARSQKRCPRLQAR